MTSWCKQELQEMAFKVLGGDLAKRLFSADSALALRSLLAKPKNPNFTQIFFDPSIAFFPNLIGSSDVDFYKDSEYGLN